MSKILIVNRGSASEKYAIYEGDKCLGYLHLEKAENEKCDYASTLFIGDPTSPGFDGASQKEEKCINKKDFENSLDYALNIFKEKGIISDRGDIVGIGIRIVAPGRHFQGDKIIDRVYEKEIKKVLRDAPLHLLPTYEMIKLLQRTFRNIPLVGVSDSDFHSTLPAKAKYYGLPSADTEKYQIERYGYHGTSVESILNKMRRQESKLPEKMIICHIGSGVSVTAVKDGQSVENSMGFTPLEGVMMATRAGDIDPGAVALLSGKFWLGTKKLKEYLNKKCGLLGVSGQSSDVRDLIKLEQAGDQPAKLALDMYVYRIQKCLGAYFTILGGLDTLIFTATVGERSFIIRERICAGLDALGVKIDKVKNDQSEGVDADISASDSQVKVLVRKTDEMGQIARDTVAILKLE